MKKLFAFSLALAMAISLTACSNGSSSSGTNGADSSNTAEKSVTLHMGGGLTTTSPQYPALQAFAEAVEEESGGTIKISLDLSGALGSDREIIEGVMNGSVEMMHMADISIGSVITELGFVNLPYLFPTRESAEDHYLYGELGNIYRSVMAENGMTILGQLLEGDFRWISNSKHEIQAPSDLSGLKIRVVDSPMYVSFFENLGCNPVAMSVSEVAAALQQNVIDGQDNGPLNTYFYGFYDFQSYMTKTNHAYAANMLCINTDVYESLSENQQTILSEQAEIYTALAYEYQVASIDGFCEEMEKAGMHIVETTEELSTFMKEASTKVWADESITGMFNQDAMAYINENLAG